MQINESIIAIFDELCAKFGMAIDWTAENVLPYLQELCRRYITYEISVSAVKIATPFLIAFIFLVVAIITSHKAKKVDWDFECYIAPILAAISWIAFVIAMIVFFTTAYDEAFHIVECLTIPEKVILDYLSSVLNG